VDKERIKHDPRFPFGMPRVDNANYLWIQVFYSSLNSTGRAGFVMANSACDARDSEMQIRRELVEQGIVDVVISVGPNFFYTVTLSCMLWFFDRRKSRTDKKDTILVIDARRIYRQVDRAHREFAPAQIEFLANLVRLYRGERMETAEGSGDLMKQYLGTEKPLEYRDVEGLCKVVNIKDLDKGWSLNPSRHVGAIQQEDETDLRSTIVELHMEFDRLSSEAEKLSSQASKNIRDILGSWDA